MQPMSPEQEIEPTPSSRTDSPKLPYHCDLVMKGGLTSGIVYPPAIKELAKDHRFHNVGGASAGAIAAVTTAAAEYGRQNGGPGFEDLAQLPEELAHTTAGVTKLQALFLPQAETKTYFDLLWQQRSMKAPSILERTNNLLGFALKRGPLLPASRPLWGAILLMAGALTWITLAPEAATLAFAALALLILVVVYLGTRILAGAKMLVDEAPGVLKENMHGLCNGSSVGDDIGLTDWLHEKIEAIAGPKRVDAPEDLQRPLTYGDLERSGIGLVTMTTNLSQSASEAFPFSDETWAFRPEEMKKLLPAAVAEYLIERGREASKTSSKKPELDEAKLLKLPPASELPVLLGARVSLSFPVLISAVPLYRLTPIRNAEGKWDYDYRQVWLSDGGICSNLPAHLFDAPLPSKPTYGINLATGLSRPVPAGDDEATQMSFAHQNVWRPLRTNSGSQPVIYDIASTAELLGEVLNTMQNWSDNTMSRAIGVRDRICTIRMAKNEGGMNLDMGPEVIAKLQYRGRAAGENLGWMVRGEAPPHAPAEKACPGQWARHRWTRLRAGMVAMDEHLEKLRTGFEKESVPQHGPTASDDISFAALVDKAHELEYLPYRSKWDDGAAQALKDALRSLRAVDFGPSSSASPPPLRRLTLSTRADPETELES
ncbi:MAG: hypothetical protein AAGD10_15170 [Myxococcota bacterium]